MIGASISAQYVLEVSDFESLITTPYKDSLNAICWSRKPSGNYAELVEKIPTTGNITTLEPEELLNLSLSEEGAKARQTVLSDWELLKSSGALPTLNLIKRYDTDDTPGVFPTDVYSFHVDQSPVPAHTFLCTYFGEPSDILPNTHAIQKIQIPEIRAEIRKHYTGPEHEFETYLSEHFLDLHYQPKPNAEIISLGIANMWRLAVAHPGSKVPPCIHRAPKEKNGLPRLLLIC